ncbi:MAG: histidine phosphatase family protein [Chloroflexota bacterium]|nr:histidine phosphatase family protein [Chloroflexota bacterium]
MRLIFVRHAESLANAEGRMQGHADFHLSDRGRQQAEHLYTRLQAEDLSPTKIFSSPLSRTAETAKIVSKGWPQEIVYLDTLKEHHIGVFSGLTWAEAKVAYPAMAKDLEQSQDWSKVEGAESFQEQRNRARELVGWLVNTHDQHDVLVAFTHGGFLLQIISVVLGTERLWTTPLGNTALYDFTLDQQQWSNKDSSMFNRALWQINRFGDVAHLPIEAKPIDKGERP